MKVIRLVGIFVLLATMIACDDDSNVAGRNVQQPSPEPVTFSLALTEAEFDRTADQNDLVVDGLPVQGATLTVD